jgi:hypothetical protein
VFDGLVDESLLKHEGHAQPTEESGGHDEGKCVTCIQICELISLSLRTVFMLM